ncbi:hypothetical protein T265_08395 [Opisthorchis viverrini]|uniref:Uncharacterized protein n=1 Tax=Opisthorchis viverrini TaxID=6198 RepID=A0A074Z998_OPIVI|nr:hypothetical protein T265_08395 [Opisthorchis viverrini]KER23806.1 hypothetical protein T265_08395 [Opisthorchis viverrini]
MKAVGAGNVNPPVRGAGVADNAVGTAGNVAGAAGSGAGMPYGFRHAMQVLRCSHPRLTSLLMLHWPHTTWMQAMDARFRVGPSLQCDHRSYGEIQRSLKKARVPLGQSQT